MKRALSALMIGVALSLTPNAFAQKEDVEAKTAFNAGAQAYGLGNFVAAIAAFEHAFKLTPKTGYLFSLAQAYRREYFVHHRPDALMKSIAAFAKYLEMVPSGGRRSDAATALSELEPFAATVKSSGAVMPTAVEKAPARVMVTSATPGATVSLDGGVASEAPFIGEMKPGKHVVLVSAKGHDEERRDIQLVDGGLVALDLTLRERPATMVVRTASGAEVSVDGRLVGVTPLKEPAKLTHGRHFLSIVKNGSVAYSREIELIRGESTTVDSKLVSSTQRKVAYGFLAGAVAGFAVGGVFGALTLRAESKGKSILEERDISALSPARLDDYAASRQDRDRFRMATYTALGAGTALAVTSLILYAFDRPTVTAPETVPDRTPARPTPVAPPSGMEMSAAPMVGPGLVGGSFRMAF